MSSPSALAGQNPMIARASSQRSLFFFSSRRRHTMSTRDWSSDVCSSDLTRLTVEMLTSEMIDPRGDTREGQLTLLLDDTGREIRIAGADSVIPEATNAAWLADGVTVVYLQEAVKPKLLYSIHTVRPVAGRGGALFADHVFAAAAWNAKQNIGVAIERERSLSGPPRLVALDLLKEMHRDLATLDGF